MIDAVLSIAFIPKILGVGIEANPAWGLVRDSFGGITESYVGHISLVMSHRLNYVAGFYETVLLILR